MFTTWGLFKKYFKQLVSNHWLIIMYWEQIIHYYDFFFCDTDGVKI